MVIFLKIMQRQRLWTSALMVFIMLCSFSVLATDDIIQIVTEKAKPLSYFDKNNGEIKGYAQELVRAVMEEADLNYNIDIYPWSRTYREGLSTKNTLIFSIGRTEEREDKFIWLGEIITVQNYIYQLRGNNPKKISDLADLKNAPIAISKNTLNYEHLKSMGFTNLVSLTNYPQVFKLLERQRIQYFTASPFGIMRYLMDNQFEVSRIEPVIKIQKHNPVLYLAANIDSDEQLTSKVKAAFKKIIDNGTYDRIMQPLIQEQLSIRSVLDNS